MKISDVLMAIVERMRPLGSVTSGEVQEGYAKPAFFINLFPNSFTNMNAFYRTVQLQTEISYYPAVEQVEECIIMADKLLELFANPLEVKDRFVTIESTDFDIDGTVLRMQLGMEYMDNIPPKGGATVEEEYMDELKIGGLINGDA